MNNNTNKPRWIRCYDNGGRTMDRYTVVFTNTKKRIEGEFLSLSMSYDPYHPQGVGLTNLSPKSIDTPSYGHLGKKITFDMLPEPCQKRVVEIYNDIWE